MHAKCEENMKRIAVLCLSHKQDLAQQLITHLDSQLNDIDIFINYSAVSISEGYNKLANIVSHEILVFMHHDTLVHFPIIKLCHYFEALPNVGVLGFAGTTKLTDGCFWWYGGKLYGQVIVNKNETLKYHETEMTCESPISTLHYQPIESVDSLCMTVRSNVFRQVGGYSDYGNDSWLFSDSDFCLKVQEAGYQNYVIREPVEHPGGDISNIKLWDKTKQEFLKRWGHILKERQGERFKCYT